MVRSARRRPVLVLLALLVSAAVIAQLMVARTAQPVEAAEPDPWPGLRGDYYRSSEPGAFDFGELAGTVRDPSIEFEDLEPAFEDIAGRSDDITVRWTGRIEPAYSETYTFSMFGDNGFRLWVDGELLIDHWVDDWNKEQVGKPIRLEAGKKYDIKVEYFEHYGGSHLRLRWQSDSQPKAIVPPGAFTLPEGYDPPGPRTANVDQTGKTAALDFDTPLESLPSKAAEHLDFDVRGTPWPIEQARLDADDPSIVRLDLEHAVPEPAGRTLRVSYDGDGGLAHEDGTPVPAFTRAPVLNESTYELKSKWANDIDPEHPLPKYPRPQMVRKQWQSLNGRWQFAPATKGEAVPVGRDLDERVTVPYPVESELSGIDRHEERMWYRREFTVPRQWQVGRHNRLLVHLDAVDWRSTVYVNGIELAVHKGGYDRFSVDVTPALRPGGKQELIVGVFDPTDKGDQPVGKQRLNPGGILYTAVSGIWQSVWMEPVPKQTHIRDLSLEPDPADEELQVRLETGGEDGSGRATVTARAGNRVVGRVSGPADEELTVPVPDPKLWSPEQPFLYDLEVTLQGSRTSRDSVQSYFGMRTVDVDQADGTTRMLLNGEPIFSLGPLDQGYWPDGIYTAPTDEALRFDLEQTKRLGFNSVRKHVKVESDRWYYWADRLGLLVWQDMPSMSGAPDSVEQEQFETELRQLVDQHQGSPSIVVWVPFNEGWGQYDQARIADQLARWDPTRLVDNMSGVNCCGAVDGGNGDLIDYHVYPGPGTPAEPSATRASVLGEYGGIGLPVVGHTWAGGGWGYVGEPDPDALTTRYEQMSDQLTRLAACRGLTGAIYTQTTDVEEEINGLMTYDRAVIKPDVDRLRRANQQVIDHASRGCTAGAGG